ncbi:Methylthioribose-1-phosphate isomerase [Salix suchowensis]|nr:Methylthioribose-1-phosphate isomerase [Salix suchowensis]
MNPYEGPFTPHEQTLRDEVIYLHSLWHQGPPTLNPNPYPPTDVNYSSRNLHVSNPTPFKKTNRHKPKYQKANNVAPAGSASDPRPDPGPEWPLNSPHPSPPPSGSGWLEFRSNPRPSSRPATESDQGKVSAMHMQQKAVKCCNQFVVKRVDLDGNGDNELDEADGDDDCSWNDSVVEESEEFKFFLSFFVENQEMRDFYEKNTERGDFYCLVCGGKGEKVGKSYRGCASLLQHARTIWKKKRNGPHRAFGHLICKVLGWDISRLPMIVLKGEPLSHLLVNSGQTENFVGGDGKKVLEDLSDDVANMEAKKEGATDCLGEPEINADCGHEGANFPQTETVHGNVSVSASREDSVIHHKSCVRVSCKNSSKGGTVNQHVKDLEKDHIKANKLRVLDSKANLKESGGNYKKQNIAFWVNYCCWPETKLSESTKKANSRRRSPRK